MDVVLNPVLESVIVPVGEVVTLVNVIVAVVVYAVQQLRPTRIDVRIGVVAVVEVVEQVRVVIRVVHQRVTRPVVHLRSV